jgi:hypothetical protein
MQWMKIQETVPSYDVFHFLSKQTYSRLKDFAERTVNGIVYRDMLEEMPTLARELLVTYLIWRPTYVCDLSPWYVFVRETLFSVRYELGLKKHFQDRARSIVKVEYRYLRGIDYKSLHFRISVWLPILNVLLDDGEFFIVCISVYSCFLETVSEFKIWGMWQT